MVHPRGAVKAFPRFGAFPLPAPEWDRGLSSDGAAGRRGGVSYARKNQSGAGKTGSAARKQCYHVLQLTEAHQTKVLWQSDTRRGYSLR